MDRSEAERITRENLDDLASTFGIAHWTITVRFDLRDGDAEWEVQGNCRQEVDYDRALIRLDPETFRDEDDLLRVLRHELFHVVLSPFTLLHDALRPLIKKDETFAEVMEAFRINAVERGVINLERMYAGLTKHHTAKEPKPMAKASPKKATPKAAKSKVMPESKAPARPKKGKKV